MKSFNLEPVIVLNHLFCFLLQVTWRKLSATLLTLCSFRAILEPAWSLCSSLSHLKSSTSSSEHSQHYSKRCGDTTSHYLYNLAPRPNREGKLSSWPVFMSCYKWQSVFPRKPCNNFILAFFPGPSPSFTNSWRGGLGMRLYTKFIMVGDPMN